jgi:RNA polymerase sigma-70 factor (ECF subfamily)
MSYRDIAAALEVPIGTVMTWLHRGRAQLKRALESASVT